MAQTKQSTISPTLQKFFAGSIITGFGLQVIQTIYYVVQQYPDNQNFSGLIPWAIGIIIPLFVWFVLYLSRTKRTMTLQTIFETTLVATGAGFLAIGIGWLTSFFYMYLPFNERNFQWISALYSSLPFIIVIPLLVIMISRLRRAKQW